MSIEVLHGLLKLVGAVSVLRGDAGELSPIDVPRRYTSGGTNVREMTYFW